MQDRGFAPNSHGSPSSRGAPTAADTALEGGGYSPLDQIDRDNVGRLRMVWSRGLGPGAAAGDAARLRRRDMPNPRDVIQALDAVPGDIRWEYRRDPPDDLEDYMLGALTEPLTSWPGRRRSSTTASTPPTRARVRSSPTGRSSRVAAARRAAGRTPASSSRTTRPRARNCGGGGRYRNPAVSSASSKARCQCPVGSYVTARTGRSIQAISALSPASSLVNRAAVPSGAL